MLKTVKFALLSVFTLCFVLGTAFDGHADGHKAKGGFQGPSVEGGFSGPGPNTFSIMDALNQADDTWVTLKGNIVRHIGDDKYAFKDASGEGVVEIDDDDWRGIHVGPNDTVVLVAKVDKDWGNPELEVKTVKVAK